MTFTLSGDFIAALLVNAILLGVAYGILREKVNGLVANAKDHGSVRKDVTTLMSEVKHIQDTIDKQLPALVAQAVASAISAMREARAA